MKKFALRIEAPKTKREKRKPTEQVATEYQFINLIEADWAYANYFSNEDSFIYLN
ncbi:MAG: hypothetical protein M3Z26_00440 [Bacteroidota bacterium]|nr:hypothetical protein [Bacteroidota bacterium]